MLGNLYTNAKDMACVARSAKSLRKDQGKSVTFAPGTTMFNLDREQLLRRASMGAITSRHPGPSYSSILNVRRRPIKKAPSCNVMHTVHEETESKAEPDSKPTVAETARKDARDKMTSDKKGRIHRHKSDSEVELFRSILETGNVEGDRQNRRSGILKLTDAPGNIELYCKKKQHLDTRNHFYHFYRLNIYC